MTAIRRPWNLAAVLALGVASGIWSSHPARAQVAYTPQVASILNGASLQATPVVSADRRYVRMTLNPYFNTVNGFTTYTAPLGAVSGGGIGSIGGGGTGARGGGGVAGLGGLGLGGFGGGGLGSPLFATSGGFGGFGYGGFGMGGFGYPGMMGYPMMGGIYSPATTPTMTPTFDATDTGAYRAGGFPPTGDGQVPGAVAPNPGQPDPAMAGQAAGSLDPFDPANVGRPAPRRATGRALRGRRALAPRTSPRATTRVQPTVEARPAAAEAAPQAPPREAAKAVKTPSRRPSMLGGGTSKSSAGVR